MGATNPSTDELITELAAHTELSDREAEVVVHMADEIDRANTKQEARRRVADGMGIQPSTVDTYYRRALEKFARAVTTSELLSDLPNIGVDEPAEEIQCVCGSTDIKYEDMGQHGFALVCAECGEVLQAG